MKFGFMAKHRVAWPLALMCEALGVSRSGFYAWLSRPRSQRSLEDEALGVQVRQSFLGSDRTYGARRVWHDVLALGQQCGLHRIERLMREQALLSSDPASIGRSVDGLAAFLTESGRWLKDQEEIFGEIGELGVTPYESPFKDSPQKQRNSKRVGESQ